MNLRTRSSLYVCSVIVLILEVLFYLSIAVSSFTLIEDIDAKSYFTTLEKKDWVVEPPFAFIYSQK
ncbi:hypothetical protein HMI54_014254 [Coelomomyces lativittatus]|nr:hypothetical protein HMI54_014254 [Coelomomyces lativittatus]